LKGKSLLFLKKKKQKDFSEWHPRQVTKVFWFFFSKKNRFLPWEAECSPPYAGWCLAIRTIRSGRGAWRS
jgi:hypothetical protein